MYLDMCLLMTFLPVCSIPQSLHIWEASWLQDPAHLRHSPTSRGFTWAKMLEICSEINLLSDLGYQPKTLTNKQWSTNLAWWCPTIIGILLKKKENTTQQINRIFVEVEIVHPWKHDALLLQTNTGARKWQLKPKTHNFTASVPVTNASSSLLNSYFIFGQNFFPFTQLVSRPKNIWNLLVGTD